MNGYWTAALAVLVWASYPVATRAGVSGPFTALELVTLRFGVGALLFLPYLLLQWRQFHGRLWLRGVPLALFQGAGMGALVICGLQLAPANHAAALGPGVSPAWVALLGLLLFSRRPPLRTAIGAALCLAGVVALVLWSAERHDRSVLAGDAMFLAASALGALYVLQLRNWGIGAIQGAAIVSLYSALAVVPYYFWSAPAGLSLADGGELAWQVLWQGVLIGCVALIAFSHAVTRLGAERSCALIALVPVLTALLAFLFLGEAPSALEIAAFIAISAGVSIGAVPGALAPTPAARPLAAPRRSAPPAGLRVRDSAP